jgi:hypothetical protein
VSDIAGWHEHQGMTPDEIVSHYPTLTLGDVHAALAYYFDHLDEIQQEIRADREFVEQFRGSQKSSLEAQLHREQFEEAS